MTAPSIMEQFLEVVAGAVAVRVVRELEARQAAQALQEEDRLISPRAAADLLGCCTKTLRLRARARGLSVDLRMGELRPRYSLREVAARRDASKSKLRPLRVVQICGAKKEAA